MLTSEGPRRNDFATAGQSLAGLRLTQAATGVVPNLRIRPPEVVDLALLPIRLGPSMAGALLACCVYRGHVLQYIALWHPKGRKATRDDGARPSRAAGTMHHDASRGPKLANHSFNHVTQHRGFSASVIGHASPHEVLELQCPKDA